MDKSIKIIQPLFWDYEWESVLGHLASPFVIARVLELGNPEQFAVLAKQVGDKKIRAMVKVKGRKLLSPRSFNFWSLYYEVVAAA